MNKPPLTAHSYAAPLDQLLSLGRPKFNELGFDCRAFGITSEHIPELLRLVADEALHNAPSDSQLVWAPVHAWRALAALKAEQAVEPLLRLLRRIVDHDDDWVGEEVPRVLGEIGCPALEPVTAYLANPAHLEWARVAAAKALAEIGRRHAELRADCVGRLCAQLEKFADQSETLNAFLVSPLLDLEARVALPLMQRAFAAGRVDETVVGEFEDAEIELGLKTDGHHPRKPNWLTKLGAQLPAPEADSTKPGPALDGRGQAQTPRQFVPEEKVGRNDPCPCGSGKKYKKCCGKG